VRSLRLRTGAEWVAFTRSGSLPPDIPAAPWKTYKGKGWTSMGDWLGTGTVAPGKRQFLPFKRARDHAQSLHLESQARWKTYCKSGDKPDDIPTHPWQVYAGKGWVSLGDWLGTGVAATRARQYRRFDPARAFVRTLALKGKSNWRSYCRSGNKPHDISARPDHVYSEEGWVGWGDWLGVGRK
jgi:hypothetical protein